MRHHWRAETFGNINYIAPNASTLWKCLEGYISENISKIFTSEKGHLKQVE